MIYYIGVVDETCVVVVSVPRGRLCSVHDIYIGVVDERHGAVQCSAVWYRYASFGRVGDSLDDDGVHNLDDQRGKSLCV